jgi:hypothetical protein
MQNKEKFFGNPYLLQMLELDLDGTSKMDLTSSFTSTSNGNMIMTGSAGTQILDISGGLSTARTRLGRSGLDHGPRTNQLNVSIREVLANHQC